MRSPLVASCLIIVAACGGGSDATAPEPFPDVSGVYNVTGTFDDIPASQGSFSGTLTLTQNSRQEGTLGGTFAVTVTINGNVLTGTPSLQQASVSPVGVVSFILSDGGIETWTFSGTRSGAIISGRHTLSDGTSQFSGNWTTGASTPPTSGTLQITSSTTGDSPDADGYVVTIDGTQVGSLGPSDAGTIPVVAGSHLVGLSGIAANCHVQGQNPRTVTVAAGATSQISFAVVCTAPPTSSGSLQITTATSGTVQDADGYAVSLDGADRGLIGANAVLTLGSLSPGSHVVGLTGVAANCQVQGDNPRAVSITTGQTATLTFMVTCTQPPPMVGVLRVTTTTTGSDQDADGYRFAVDGAEPQPIGVNAATNLANTQVGPHTVVLSDVAANCTVDDASQGTVVTQGGTATVAFRITCTSTGPTTGSIRVTTTTGGSNPDDGYLFSIDGGSNQPIGASGSQTIGNVTAGNHTVVLSGVAGNCSVNDASQGVTVTAGQTADVNFAITCAATTPSASESSMLADPRSIPTGSSSTVTVTVRDASGRRMPGVVVSLASSGSGNTINPSSAASETTNANGVATFTFSSTVAEDKTITATAGGVTFDDTEVITVFRRSSAIQITTDQNDPSAPGETITVTFIVTVQGGGSSTGTVDISSLEEGNAGCTVDVSAGSCSFALNTPGLHHLQASYSGDSQFENSSDPDGEEHTVAPAGIGLSNQE
jgi:hypothetical protein